MTQKKSTTPVTLETSSNNSHQLPLEQKFDFDRFRRPVDYTSELDSERDQLVVPLRRPGPQVWFRTHPHVFESQENNPWFCNVAIFEWSKESESGLFLVGPDVESELEMLMGRAVRHRLLVPYIDRQNTVALWPVGFRDQTSFGGSWHQSAVLSAKAGADQWVRIVANKPAGGYDLFRSSMTDAPRWPAWSIGEYLSRAFQDRIIDTPDHAIVQQLRGEA